MHHHLQPLSSSTFSNLITKTLETVKTKKSYAVKSGPLLSMSAEGAAYSLVFISGKKAKEETKYKTIKSNTQQKRQTVAL